MMSFVSDLVESLRKFYDDYKTRRKFEQSRQVDISIEEFSKYLEERIKSCFDESVKTDGHAFEQSVKGLRYLQNIIEMPLRIPGITYDDYQEIFLHYANPWMRVQESIHLLTDALLLALSGRYTVAFSSVRSSLESVIQGAFYHGVMEEECREKARAILHNTPPNYPCRIRNLIEETLEEIPEDSRTSFILEIEFLKKLMAFDSSLMPPAVSSMLRAIIDIYQFPEFDDPFQYLYDELYGTLSIYTHVSMESTTTMQYSEDEGVEFDSGRVSKRMITEFLKWFDRTLDAVGLIYLRSVKDMFGPQARSTVVSIDSGISEFGSKLEFTIKSLYENVGLG
ncbi:MAG: hypothetical protein ACFFCP_19475 [Promethearchaeota archaeon]